MQRGPYFPPDWEAHLFGLLCVAVMIGGGIAFKLVANWLCGPLIAAQTHTHHLTEEELEEMRAIHPHVFTTPIAAVAFVRVNRPSAYVTGAREEFEAFAAATPPGKKAVFIVDLGSP